MNGIPIGIDPSLVHLGSVEIRWYGLAIAVGVIAAVWVAMLEARRKGLVEEEIQNMALFGVIGGIIGSRLFHVIDKLDYYMSNPLSIFAFQQGGLAIWGGVVGGVAIGGAYVLYKRMPFRRVADLAAPALLTGQIIGRIGCTINGDAFGAPTTLPWGFIYQHPNSLVPPIYLGVPTHPYPVYEMLWNLALLGLIWGIRKRVNSDGLLFAIYIAGYSIGRFVLTFVREEQIVAMGLQQAQLIAIGGLVLAALLALYVKVLRPSQVVNAGVA